MYPASSNWDSKKAFWIFVLLISSIFIYQWISSPMVITLTGVGEASAPAEKAILTFSAVSQGDSSAVALANVKARADKIREVLTSNGVLEEDIYQSQALVYPSSSVSQGTSGFTATTSMGFKTTNILKLDILTSAIYSQGASIVTQPLLTAKDSTSLTTNAYQLALKDADNQAKKIALKNFKVFKKVVLVQDATSSQSSGSVTSNLDGSGVLKVNKILSVSYKMW